MELIILVGNAATGKMTVGQAIMKKTSFRLFHNHMTIEPVLDIFGYFNRSLIYKWREAVFESAIENQVNLIFTFMWAFDEPEDHLYIENLIDKVEKKSGTVYIVELIASKETRLERNKTENRLINKASKRDINLSEQRLLKDDASYRLESYNGEVKQKHYIKIDNSLLSAEDTADIIIKHFNLQKETS